MKIILFITFLIILFVILYLNKYFCKIKPIDKALKKLNLKMMKDIDYILVTNNIKYWAEGGTLLGIVRHNGPIPWDDDTDISILEEDYEKVNKLKNQFKKRGYKLINHFFGFKVCYSKGGKYIKGKKYSYPFLDIFTRKKVNNKYILSRTKLWSKYYFLDDEVFPLKRYKFDNIYINGPSNPRGYLNRGYKGWDYLSVSTGGHHGYGSDKRKTCFNFLNR